MIHGPNLNNLGKRDPEHYGALTLTALEVAVNTYAHDKNMTVTCFQSNFEGALIDTIQSTTADAILINAGALTHYSYALFDALVDSGLPCVEVHLSDIKAREPWRAHSVISPACIQTIMGKKLVGYLEAIDFLSEKLHHAH
jgi:3-dehydroquinate dehydratase-2